METVTAPPTLTLTREQQLQQWREQRALTKKPTLYTAKPTHQRRPSASSRENSDPNTAHSAAPQAHTAAATIKPTTTPATSLHQPTRSSVGKRRSSLTTTAAANAAGKAAGAGLHSGAVGAVGRGKGEVRQSVKRGREEKLEGSSAVINVILASENVKLAESILWTKPKAAKKQRTEEDEEGKPQSTDAGALADTPETTATPPVTLSITVSDEHALQASQPRDAASISNTIANLATPPASPWKTAPSTTIDIVQTTRAALEAWVASHPTTAANTTSFAQSTPSRLRHTTSPTYIAALHSLAPLLSQHHYTAALTQLDTIATLFSCHRSQAEYWVLRAFVVEKAGLCGGAGAGGGLGGGVEGQVCGVYRTAMDGGAQPASGVLEGFQSFERRYNAARLGLPLAGSTSAAALSAASTNVPATPMSRLLHQYRSARPSVAATPSVVAASSMSVVVPATPRSAMLRSSWLNDDERDSGVPAVALPTPRSAQLRALRLTPESEHTPPAVPATQQPQQQQQPMAQQQVDTPRTQPNEPAAAIEQTTPQLARSLLDDMQAAEETATPPVPRTPADALSPLAPLPLSICSPLAEKDAMRATAESTADASAACAADADSSVDDADTSMASPEAPAGLFDEDEYIPGLSTPFAPLPPTQSTSTAAIIHTPNPAPSTAPSLSAYQPAPAAHQPAQPSSVVVLASVRASASVSRALGSEFFVSPVRRSTRHMVGRVDEAQLSGVAKQQLLEDAHYSYLPNNALQPPKGASRARSTPKPPAANSTTDSEQQSSDDNAAALTLSITVEPVQTEADEPQQPIFKAVPRKGTPMHARRPNAAALLPPPPIAQPNLIVLQPIRSSHHGPATTTASSTAPSTASSASALFVSPVRRSARHSVDWTSAAHETVVQLEAGKVELKPNASLGDREQEWKVQAERDRAAMPPPPPRMPRSAVAAVQPTPAFTQPAQQRVEGGEGAVLPAPAGRFEGGKRHATPRPSGTRRSSRLGARDEGALDGLEEDVAQADEQRAAAARVTRRRSQRF